MPKSPDNFTKEVTALFDAFDKKISHLKVYADLVKASVESYFTDNMPGSDSSFRRLEKDVSEMTKLASAKEMYRHISEQFSEYEEHFADDAEFQNSPDKVAYIFKRLITPHLAEHNENTFYKGIEDFNQYYYLTHISVLLANFEALLHDLVLVMEKYKLEQKGESVQKGRKKAKITNYLEVLTTNGVEIHNYMEYIKKIDEIRVVRNKFIHELTRYDTEQLKNLKSYWLFDDEVGFGLMDMEIPEEDFFTDAYNTLQNFTGTLKSSMKKKYKITVH